MEEAEDEYNNLVDGGRIDHDVDMMSSRINSNHLPLLGFTGALAYRPIDTHPKPADPLWILDQPKVAVEKGKFPGRDGARGSFVHALI